MSGSDFERGELVDGQWQPANDNDDFPDVRLAPRKVIPEADRVLLKQVAMALGAISFEEVDGEGYANLRFADGSMIHSWNPLQFSNDGFDLLTTLDVYVFQSLDTHETQASAPGHKVIYQLWNDDRAAATRRAVVRGAAEIGKQRS